MIEKRKREEEKKPTCKGRSCVNDSVSLVKFFRFDKKCECGTAGVKSIPFGVLNSN